MNVIQFPLRRPLPFGAVDHSAESAAVAEALQATQVFTLDDLLTPPILLSVGLGILAIYFLRK